MNFLKKIFAPKEVKCALELLNEIDRNFNLGEFRLPRQVVESTLLARQKRFVMALKSQNRTPQEKLYSMIESVTGDYLESGARPFFVYRGLLSFEGQGLLRVYDYILKQMVDINYISEKEALEQQKNIRDRIKEAG